MRRDLFWAATLTLTAVASFACLDLAGRATADRDRAAERADRLAAENLQLRAFVDAHVRAAMAGADPAGPERIPPADLPVR